MMICNFFTNIMATNQTLNYRSDRCRWEASQLIAVSFEHPFIPPATIKRRERELVPHLWKMAEENCRKSLITCWLRNMFSLVYTFNTGHATLIGQSTKKCIAYAVKSKRCKICQNAKTKGVPARKHTCSNNWSASAKSMEPAVSCEMLQGLMYEGRQVHIQLMWHGCSYYIHKTHTKQDKNCE